ncbi:uncharacterized protein GGS22DRAFT_158267 [Annulohypoxylon maeteangense]|uniref:uncharacterized protein n=1 Tax=Annulohypoxylon maeteangense TaxID=1927788 RepID=UPI002007633E|nr:uncharacterized protein GGS22DRAFT_158267 [Annulohypoxylon maeteangense]KAI0886618.1 hypothetical protein GGS22DRAFT_158267 [Annulohypoxylon maeteangense]
MSHQSASSVPTMTPRRPSTGSEKTLVDTLTQKVDASERDDDQKSSLDARSTRSQRSTSSVRSVMDKAAKKVKSKLGGESSTSDAKPKSKPKPKQPAQDPYPDTVYMWRALAETRL